MRPLLASDVMTKDVVTAAPDAPIPELAELMTLHRIGGVPIVGEDARLVGMVTDRDLLVKAAGAPGGIPALAMFFMPPDDSRIAEHVRRVRGCLARDVMTSPVTTAPSEAPAREVAALMVRHRIGRVPIVDGQRVVGIVTRTDVLRIFERGDDTVSRDARELLGELMPGAALDVACEHGLVTVRGTVVGASDVRAIEVALRSIDGVVGVEASHVRVAA